MSRRNLAFIAAGAALLITGCSSTPKPATVTNPPAPAVTAPAAAVSTPAASAPASSPAAASGLSGSWSGQYGGAYSGTFTLTWTQTGSDLSGKITLSNPAGTTNLHGTVNGSAISFGTVGSTAVTYTGSVSGTSMSGNYQVGGQTGGTWSASKSS
jgi:outer membrane biogenesis lipoprotein LolB